MCEVARSYLRGRVTVSLVIRETCNALWDVLSSIYMAPPSEEEWNKIKMKFYDR